MTHRRGNGLLADAYVPLILLPPASADLMLEALGRAGIAAYAIRLDAGVPDPSPEAGATATDHLYVDERERDAAERVLRAELPDLDGDPADPGAAGPAAEGGAGVAGVAEGTEPGPRGNRDEDDVWADLVARFYESGTGDEGGAPAWPDAENVAPGRADRAEDPGVEDTAPSPVADDDDDGSERRGARASEDEGEHFVPPPPPPLPRGDMVGRLAWGGLFGGPAVLLVSMLMGTRPGWLAFCAVAAFIAGFVVLVVRMGDRASGDNGPDDGAVV
ncbi:hypothetical protein O4J56_27875 [Nocardiopsis sp. RSe5-2]|uniref:DUF2007 domain-containing protein n=1 Tax=Nocardiopsis endophytica TaxID=3018445 RepID=A0ABT4UBZ3_9ACTN|nr:hypothetical protein [Nocardiopsis endophytica]MDA2814496.1 hypothetical protein [Nocardiopsis endophytica]